MELFLFILKIASGPVVGGLIGLFTNYVAIKMLFHPYKEKRIFGRRLPFTPGMVPKRKDELARAVGNAVSQSLITPEDIKKQFMTEEVTDKIGEAVASYVFDGEAIISGNNGILEGIDKISDFAAKRIVDAAKDMDLGEIIADKAKEAVVDNMPGVLSVLVPEKMIAGLIAPLGGKIDEYIEDEGYDLIYPAVKKELTALADAPLAESAQKIGLSRESLKSGTVRVYKHFVADKLSDFAAQLDIAGIVEQKIKDMDIKELEKLVLSVSKKELYAIVWLGGLLGFVIGIVTSAITLFL